MATLSADNEETKKNAILENKAFKNVHNKWFTFDVIVFQNIAKKHV